MAASEKIVESLKAAITYAENSIQALDRNDENALADSLWHVGAELEYALFLFSMASQKETKPLQLDKSSELKKTETDKLLAEVHNFLKEAEDFIVNGKLLDAYKSVYTARNHVFKLHEDLAKKKREARKKK